MVNVIDKTGAALAPTRRHAKVRHMLKDGRATIAEMNPFTIQLQYEIVGPIVIPVPPTACMSS